MSGRMPEPCFSLRTPPPRPPNSNLAAAAAAAGSRGGSGIANLGPTGKQRRRGRRPRRWLVVVGLALGVSLLAGAGLETKNYLLLRAIAPGCTASREVLTASVELPIQVPVRLPTRLPVHLSAAGGGHGARGAEAALIGRLVDRAARVPGVVAAAATSNLPTLGARLVYFSLAGHPEPAGSSLPQAQYVLVTPGYFAALEISIRSRPPSSGLSFGARDGGAASPVAIVNQAFADQFFPGEEPLGKRIGLAGSSEWREIVGVAADVRQDGLESPAMPIAYFLYAPDAPPTTVDPATPTNLATNLVVRVAAGRDAASLAAPLRRAAAANDPSLALAKVRTMAELLDGALAGSRSEMVMAALYAAATLALAVVGLYRAMSWSAAQHFAAGRRRMQRKVVKEGLSLAGVGTMLGLGGVTCFRMGLLCMPPEGNRSWYDPAVLALASLLLLAIAACTSWLAAARAASLEVGAARADARAA
jgi:putative ABC transport system permease protein